MTTLSFFGAAGEVTGSCYLVETGRARVLVDFGIHQGDIDADLRNRTLPPIEPEGLDAVVLTHGHLDHCGRLPVLEQHGGEAPIYSTPGTLQLADIILSDAASLQEADAQDENRRRAREGKPPVLPLFTESDARRVLGRFKTIPYGRDQEIASGVSIRFFDAGHIIGSASVRMTIRGDGHGPDKVIVFSGDIGQLDAPILRDPEPPTADGGDQLDAVVLESTYGDRDHRPLDQTLDELVEILNRARDEDGKVLIPAFAVGRTQDLVYHLGELIRSGRIPRTRVYVDSPMATAASRLYESRTDVHDEVARRLAREGSEPLAFEGLRYTRSRQESQALNTLRGGAVIIAGSGMCTGGRIVHHLRNSIGSPTTHVIIVGFQGKGTLGRRLVSGDKRVRILHEMHEVHAQIHTLGGFSAHAGQTGLLAWAEAVIGERRPRMFLTHGEDMPRSMLADKLHQQHGITAELPEWGGTAEF